MKLRKEETPKDYSRYFRVEGKEKEGWKRPG